tara:strand:+ start:3154 stop:3804 length:651 start_codon:yes stop_codon:yes gene_type:complete
MDFLFADSEAEKMIEEAKDKRLKKGLTNVSKACRALLLNNKKLTYEEIGDYCVENFKTPGKGAFGNGSDSSKKYKELIGFYKSLIKVDRKDDEDELSELPIGVKAYISQLEQRNNLLEKVQKEIDGKSLRTEVVSLTDTIKSHGFESDHANTVVAQGVLTTEQKKSLRVLLFDLPEYVSEELEIQGDDEMVRLVSKSTGVILLNPRQYNGLKDLLK